MDGTIRSVIHRLVRHSEFAKAHFSKACFWHSPITARHAPEATHNPKVPMSCTIRFLCPEPPHHTRHELKPESRAPLRPGLRRCRGDSLMWGATCEATAVRIQKRFGGAKAPVSRLDWCLFSVTRLVDTSATPSIFCTLSWIRWRRWAMSRQKTSATAS